MPSILNLQFHSYFWGGRHGLRLYKSLLLTGCSDKLISDDPVNSVPQYKGPFLVKTSQTDNIFHHATHKSGFITGFLPASANCDASPQQKSATPLSYGMI